MRIIAIDPGPELSAFVEWDGESIFGAALVKNHAMRDILLSTAVDRVVIEKVACYGMPVGESIFETVYWTGRFAQASCVIVHRMPRIDVKMHLCKSARAKDSNVIQALIDRFAPFVRNKGKGTKGEPGFFYGFKKDIWQSFALAVTWMDLNWADMEICEYGADAEAQKECKEWEKSEISVYCFKFRDLDGFFHCNGLEDRTKEK
jgi:hypothetical protein